MKPKSDVTKAKDRARSRAWYAIHKDEIKPRIQERQRAWYLRNREEIKLRRKTYRETHRAETSARGRVRNYGLTPSDFEAHLINQGGACAICQSTEWGKRGPHVDHDHSSGKVRALLCHDCNLALGFAKDDPIIISRMLNYITKGGF